jgi:hypothetical protein
MKTKICSKCGEEKELVEFKKDRTKKDGLYSSCKDCVAVYRSRDDVKKRDREAKRAYWRANPQKQKESAMRYRQKNKDRLYEKRQQWLKGNKEYIKKYNHFNTDNLTDVYVIANLRQRKGVPLSTVDIKRNKKLIDINRKQLQLKRIKRQILTTE